MRGELTFSVRGGDEVSPAEWSEVSSLFSTEYGFYSAAAPRKAGDRICLGSGYYQRFYATDDYRVAFCRDGSQLVAEAIYLERKTDRGMVALVVQLVVATGYRRRGIASTLLHSVWGFSDYYAWGIVSSNASTIEALQSATFRKASPAVMAKSAEWLRMEVLSSVPFLAKAAWRISEGESVVGTAFYTDRTQLSGSTNSVSSRLGVLAEGEEWLAVVFRQQEPDDLSAYRSMIAASGEIVRTAYRHMPQNEQRWASRTADEIDVVPTKTMQESGEFFDGKCILVDERRRLVCHKEQFPFGKGLPSGEFLIRDRRFTAAEISAGLEAAGLKVVQTRFVRAGFKVEYAVSTGKEILLFAKKGSK